MNWAKGKNIVLDLDETLIATADDMSDIKEFDILYDPNYVEIRNKFYLLELDDAVDPAGSGITSNMYGCFRPHVKEFLMFCTLYFKRVIIWTAGKEKYGQGLVNLLFRGLPGPHAVLTWDDCVIERESELVVKPLKKLYKMFPDMNETNTIVIDDRLTTFEKHNPDNAVHIPGYTPKFTPKYISDDPDVALVDLIMFFSQKEVNNADDIREIKKPDKKYWTPTPTSKVK